jgi:hypothetical protein
LPSLGCLLAAAGWGWAGLAGGFAGWDGAFGGPAKGVFKFSCLCWENLGETNWENEVHWADDHTRCLRVGSHDKVGLQRQSIDVSKPAESRAPLSSFAIKESMASMASCRARLVAILLCFNLNRRIK